ncbi:MAG: diguanylate cyclase/phosphodiesterase [Pseudomonas sp.]|nr:diguanylate cyclase/phosphodiesterase [Pseudomonas sp.]
MNNTLPSRLRALMSVHNESTRLLKAQFFALSRQLPLMYYMLVINSLALAATHYAFAPRWLTVYCPLAMALMCGGRAIMWWRTRGLEYSPDHMFRALRRTNYLAGIIALGFTLWSLALFPYGDSYTQAHVAFYMAITVVACIFSMMHLRPAALVTTIVVNTTFILFFISTRNLTFIAMAISVMLVSIAMLFILQNQYLAFTEMVNMQANTEKLSRENQLLANRDSLTGLPNRRQFFSALEKSLCQARTQTSRLAVGLMDLDGFKPVNDLYGHSVGDELLIQVGQRLSALCDQSVHIARLGGDEFALIINDASHDEHILEFAHKACARLREPFLLVDRPIQISASLGLATFPDMASNETEMYEYADYALYKSKRSQPGEASLFSVEHLNQFNNHAMIEQALRRADLNREFSVVFQPVVNSLTYRTVAFEALARWDSPELGHVRPGQFIPIAERIGLIHQLTLPLLEKALKAAQTWPPQIRLSFNLSVHDCASPEITQSIIDVIQNSGYDPTRLDLEITETAVILDMTQVQRATDLFRQLGCGISLDDFGTGYSSLSQIHTLSLTKLKIDRSFVTGIQHDPISFKIVKSLIALSQDMGLECIVEGVETLEELTTLRSLGCSLVQGYLFSPALTLNETASWLEHPATNPN